MDALCVAMLIASAALTPAAAVSGVETHQRSWGVLAAPAVGGLHRDATLTAPASAPLMALRLKGGRGCTGTRNSCKQRGYHINAGVQKNAKRNKPIALSHKPCSGPHALSKVERYHGADVVLQVLWQGSPRAPFYDPRTAAIRHGLRWNRLETNTKFKMVHKDLNHCLLKACHRGLTDLVPGLVDKGSQINFVGEAKTGLSAELVGLTPISAAAHQGWPILVRMLLDLGADHRGGIMDDPRYAEDGKKLWMHIAKENAARRTQTKKAMDVKMRPWGTNGRRTPGRRRTRVPHGATRPKSA